MKEPSESENEIKTSLKKKVSIEVDDGLLLDSAMEEKVWNVLIGPFEKVERQIKIIKAPYTIKYDDYENVIDDTASIKHVTIAFELLAAYKKFKADVLIILNHENQMKKQLRLKVYNALEEGSPDKEFKAKDESVLNNVPVQILTKLRFAEK